MSQFLTARIAREVSGLKSSPSGDLKYSADHAGLEVEEHAQGTYLPPKAMW
jgi:hypothetical protein